MKKLHFLFSLMFSFALAAGAGAFGDERPLAVHVGGDVAKAGDWNASSIRKELAADVKPIQYTSHGDPHTAHCVALIDLLKAAGAKTEMKMDPKANPKMKNEGLRYVVVVRATDGYVVAFSLAELMPEVGNRAVWVALDMDEKPLSERDGPLRLIVPQDKKPSRSVHAVQSITVVDAAAVAATQPLQ